MQSFLLGCLRFFLFFVVVYIISLILIYRTNTGRFIPNVFDKSKNNGFLLSRLREVNSYHNVDLLFLGSSHACRAFDPRIFSQFGFTSFNLGSSAQTPINSEFLCNRYIDTLRPKILIYEVFWGFFENEGIESALDIIGNSTIERENLNIIFSDSDLRTYNTAFFTIVNRLFDPLERIRQQQFLTDRYITGGYIEKLYSDTINNHLPSQNLKRKIVPLAKQLKAFERVLVNARAKGIEVIAVSAPVTREYLGRNENYSEFADIIANIAQRYNVQYFDYNSPGFPEFNSHIDFYDSNHLSQKGVKKFNDHFIQNILFEINQLARTSPQRSKLVESNGLKE